jgi:hypothetical protein
MCLIVDSNEVSRVFLNASKEFEKLNQAVSVGKTRIVYGGELTREYRRVNRFWRLLLILDRQGRARQVGDVIVDQETERVREMGICRSDDHHIIALARVGRVRLVCSNDQRLRRDVRNPRLLANPRGNIYNNSDHSRLLRKHCPSEAGGARRF